MQTDDELTRFAAQGAPPLLPTSRQGFVEHDGARIWYAAYGAAPTVILLHGGWATAATGGISCRRCWPPGMACWSSTAVGTGAARATPGLTVTIAWPMICWR